MKNEHDCHAIRVVALDEIAASAGHKEQLDAIFYEASSVQAFVDVETKERFRHRWLGRYLQLYPSSVFLAVTGGDNRIVGYIAGCIDDPAQQRLFDDIGYFGLLADLTTRYPAHFHINVAPGFRSGGVGAALTSRFVEHAHAQGAGGVHVVTAQAARNVRFYMRNDFQHLRAFTFQDKALVMLGRLLSGDSPVEKSS